MATATVYMATQHLTAGFTKVISLLRSAFIAILHTNSTSKNTLIINHSGPFNYALLCLWKAFVFHTLFKHIVFKLLLNIIFILNIYDLTFSFSFNSQTLWSPDVMSLHVVQQRMEYFSFSLYFYNQYVTLLYHSNQCDNVRSRVM